MCQEAQRCTNRSFADPPLLRILCVSVCCEVTAWLRTSWVMMKAKVSERSLGWREGQLADLSSLQLFLLSPLWKLESVSE